MAREGLPVEVCCRVLAVSCAGYYAWRFRPPSARAVRHAWLTDLIREVHAASYGSYGANRVHAELVLGRGITVGHNAVAMLMRRAGIAGRNGARRWRGARLATAEDLVDRQFRRSRPNELWLTDITEHPTREGKVYCAVVLDAFSRRVAGWSISHNPTAGLTCNALGMAVEQRDSRRGTVIHSDQPAQHPVERRDELREVHAVPEHGPDAARTRERPDQRIRRCAPRRLRKLEPIQLQLLARLVRKLDRQPVPAAFTDRALQPQRQPAQLSRQRLVGAIEAERTQLPQQHRRVQVRIVREAALDVGPERLEHARRPRSPAPLTPRQPGTDRLAIPTGVARDRAHRPAPPAQRHDLHQILPRQQAPALLRIDGDPSRDAEKSPGWRTAAPLLRFAYGSATKQGGRTESPGLGNIDEHI
jgi:putative transposase